MEELMRIENQIIPYDYSHFLSSFNSFIAFSAGWPSWLLISFLYSPVLVDLLSFIIVFKNFKHKGILYIVARIYIDASAITLCLEIWRGKNRKSKVNPSELPGELVLKIANLLDFVAFSGVCRLWRCVCLTMKWRPGHQFPWLILFNKEHSQNQSLFSFYRNNRYEVKLPQVSGKRCHGSPHGWIVTMSSDLDAHLLHLLSRVEVNLPKLNTIRNQIGVLVAADPFCFIHKCILLKISDDDDQFLVIAIFGPSYCLAFARPGFVQWKTVGGLNGVKDVVLYNGQIHAICGKGRLLRFASADPESTARLVAYQPEDVIRVERIYLLESSGELLGVYRYSSSTPFEQRNETKRFIVYKLQSDINGNVGRWQRLNDLGDWAVFVGEGNSWSICTTNIPNHRSNCIYFTDDNWDKPGTGGHDIGVFDMVNKQIESLDFGSHSPSYHSRAVWFTPSLPPCKKSTISMNMNFENCGKFIDRIRVLRRWEAIGSVTVGLLYFSIFDILYECFRKSYILIIWGLG